MLFEGETIPSVSHCLRTSEGQKFMKESNKGKKKCHKLITIFLN